MALPTRIHDTAQVRAIDRFAIDKCGIAGYTLMTRAATAALEVLRERWPAARRVLVICGPGNNGGDGYVLARLARAQGLDAAVASLGIPERKRADAATAHDDCVRAGVAVEPFAAGLLGHQDVLVDAIFGTGLDRPVDAKVAAIISRINASGIPILSLDIPSGLHSDSGHVMGTAVHAAVTVTFVGLKIGCFRGEGGSHCGELHFASLDIPDSGERDVLERLDPTLLARLLPPRARAAHKGAFGHVLVVGGGRAMPGAARLSAEAALRSGAGLVSVATRPENVATIVQGRHELMVHGVGKAEELVPLVERASVIVLGPGLGLDAWAQDLFHAVLETDRPLVVDADALNLLAARSRQSDRWILTPHPGEAARLLEIGTARVQDDRLGALQTLVARYGGVVVLKGAGTLIGRADATPAICTYGNPGMATAGMGDVLTGIIAGLFAQIGDRNGRISDLWDAARLGVLSHALAGDRAARNGERGLIASDVFEHLRRCLNPAAAGAPPSDARSAGPGRA